MSIAWHAATLMKHSLLRGRILWVRLQRGFDVCGVLTCECFSAMVLVQGANVITFYVRLSRHDPFYT